MVQAMLAVASPGFQQLYAGCAHHHGLPVVELLAHPALHIPPDLACPDRPFVLFRGDPDLRGPVIVLSVGPAAGDLAFAAYPRQPNPTPTPDGGFDDTNYYCAALDGHLAHRDGRWYAWGPP